MTNIISDPISMKFIFRYYDLRYHNPKNYNHEIDYPLNYN